MARLPRQEECQLQLIMYGFSELLYPFSLFGLQAGGTACQQASHRPVLFFLCSRGYRIDHNKEHYTARQGSVTATGSEVAVRTLAWPGLAHETRHEPTPRRSCGARRCRVACESLVTSIHIIWRSAAPGAVSAQCSVAPLRRPWMAVAAAAVPRSRRMELLS